MRPSTPFERFLAYRFDYPSLVVDSLRAFCSNAYWPAARLLSVPFTILLFAPPLVTVLVARRPFGSEALFAVVFLLWPWLLEMPSGIIRQLQSEPAWQGRTRRNASTYDWFMHVALAVLAIAAIVYLAAEPARLGQHELAVLWAVALAGGADMVRSVTAISLAELRGFPLYGCKARIAP